MNEAMYVLLSSTLAPYYGWFFAGAAVYEAGRSRSSKEASALRLILAIALAVGAMIFLGR